MSNEREHNWQPTSNTFAAWRCCQCGRTAFSPNPLPVNGCHVTSSQRLSARIKDLEAAPAAVIDAIEETFLGQLPSKALSYCAQEDITAGLDALRERFGVVPE